jgi:membrane protein implicated in regulation of membrane protease activity
VIVSADLLTDLASAPQDDQENREHLVLVTLGVGVIAGVFVMATAQIAMLALGTGLGMKELLIVAFTILAIAVLAVVLAKAQRKRESSQKITETMERMASLLSK